MTVTRRLAAILAADCDEISETGLLVAHSVISLRCGIWSLSGHSGHREADWWQRRSGLDVSSRPPEQSTFEVSFGVSVGACTAKAVQLRPNAGYFSVPGLRLAGVTFVLLRLALG